MMSYAVHCNEIFFWDVCEDSLSMAHLFIIINENFTEYSSNVSILFTNYRNEYILTVSSKKIIENMLFTFSSHTEYVKRESIVLYRINLTPPLIKTYER